MVRHSNLEYVFFLLVTIGALLNTYICYNMMMSLLLIVALHSGPMQTFIDIEFFSGGAGVANRQAN